MRHTATAEERFQGLGVEPSTLPPKLGDYVPAVLVDRLLMVSGQTPQRDGRTVVQGVLGRDQDIENAARGARIAATNALLQARQVLGSFDRVERVVRITGYVAATDDFTQHPAVIDGASELMREIFGETGRHARSAIGVASLPDGASVELDVVFAVLPETSA